jgi:hypothetical protein
MGQGWMSVGLVDAWIGDAEGDVYVEEAWSYGESGVNLKLYTRQDEERLEQARNAPGTIERPRPIEVQLSVEDAVELARLILVAAGVEEVRAGDFAPIPPSFRAEILRITK